MEPGKLAETWTRIGYDVDNEYLTLGRRLFDIDMKYGFQDESSVDVKSSDLILLSHVIEHFLDPIESLGRIANAMKKEALLLIEVPGIFRIHKTNLDPMVYMQNAHTFTFCRCTLRYVCTLSGLNVLEIDENCRAVCSRAPIIGSDKKPISNRQIRRDDYPVPSEA